MPRRGFHHKKRRSAAQKAQTVSLSTRLSQSSHQDLIPQSASNREKLKHVQLELKNAKAREKRAKTKVIQLESQLQECHTDLSQQHTQYAVSATQARDKAGMLNMALKNFESQCGQKDSMVTQAGTEVKLLEAKLATSDKIQAHTSRLLEETRAELVAARDTIDGLRGRICSLSHDRDALRKRRAYRPLPQAPSTVSPHNSPALQPLTLKGPHGTIHPAIRDLLRELAAEGVGTKHMMPVIRDVTNAFGFQIGDSISPRSVSRVVLEGFIQSLVQLAYEISEAKHISICGDGTSIKNLQHEAKLIRLPVPASSESHSPTSDPSTSSYTPALRSLGVHKAASHSAQAQRDGWIKQIDSCFRMLNASPLGQDRQTDSRVFGARVSGMVSDHASDQKLLAELMQTQKIEWDREMRGEAVLECLSDNEKKQALSAYLEVECRKLGAWDTLSAEQRDQVEQRAQSALRFSLGQDMHQKLTDEEQAAADFFVWTGCCMHKELNAVKGGVAAMSAAWEELGLQPPIPLKNKYESDKPNQGDEHTSKSQNEHSRGAVKLTSLAGAVFNHKDDKKGQKDTYKNFFEASQRYGYCVSYPDTSNTRYGSHCAAASELLVRRSSYLEFCRVVRDAKTTSTFTNIEKNVYDGLQDPGTLTELAVLALYAQSIGFPYMIRVRGGAQNALNLGVFHEQVKNRCRAIIDVPSLLLDPSLPPGSGTLDGRPWSRPDVVYCILSMSEELPHLTQILAAFFRGALKAWERFTSEFAPDSAIAQANPELRSSVWNSPTNDASEGALGQCRQMLRHKPTLTDNQRNARVMWSHNKTHQFVETHFTDGDHKFVRREARYIDGSGATRQEREELNNALMERVEANREKQAKAVEKRSANEQRLAGIQVLEGASERQLEKLTVRELDEQIDKLRKSDNELPAKSKIGNKKAKVKAIWEALECLRVLSNAMAVDKGKGKAVDEYNPFQTDKEGIPQDEEMFYPDEVPICV